MKKNYMKPAIEVLKMVSTPILAGSDPTIGIYDEGEAFQGLSRDF